jgi:hypothetical protein
LLVCNRLYLVHCTGQGQGYGSHYCLLLFVNIEVNKGQRTPATHNSEWHGLTGTSSSAWRFALLRHRVRSARDDTRGRKIEKFANLKCHSTRYECSDEYTSELYKNWNDNSGFVFEAKDDGNFVGMPQALRGKSLNSVRRIGNFIFFQPTIF